MASSLIGWAYLIVVTAVWTVFVVLQLIKLKKASEVKAKRKVKTLIALIMLLPAVAAPGAIFRIGINIFK